MTRERDETGQYVETVDPEDVLDVFDAVDGPVITSSDVAEYLECTTEAARQKLRRLVDDETLARRKTGRTVIYWRTDTDTAGDRPPAREHRKDGATSTRAESDPTPGEGTNAEHAAVTPDENLRESVRAYLDANDLPPKTDHGRAAVLDVFEYLREHGTATTSEIQNAVHPAYKDNWSTPRTMWNAIDRYLEEIPGIKKAGYGEWAYSSDDAVREAVSE